MSAPPPVPGPSTASGPQPAAPVRAPRRWLLLGLAVAVSLLAAAASIPVDRPASGNPLQRFALSDGTPRTLTGRVVERLDAGPYTYLRVRTEAGAEPWIASLSLGLPASDAVAVKVIADTPSFESRRLARTFSPLLFGVVRDADPTQATESR